MWGWIKKTAKKIGRAISGGISTVINGVVWLVRRFTVGALEAIFSLMGFRPAKKLRLKVIILKDANNKALAAVSDVEAVVDRAKDVFREQANIRIVPSVGSDVIVEEIVGNNPEYVLVPKCDSAGLRQIFTRVGRWFRRHSNPYSRKGGATVFVVENVIDKNGCFLGPPVDYGYIDPGAIYDSPGVPATGGRKLTLAHELGHGCDLWHSKKQRNLMAKRHESASGSQRTSALARWQESIIRSSGRARYW